MYEIYLVIILVSAVTVISSYYYYNADIAKGIYDSNISRSSVSDIKLPKILPSSFRPFKDLVYGIHKSYLNSITDDYNKLILTIFDIVNRTELKKITIQNIGLLQRDITINSDLIAFFSQIRSDYPEDIGQTLLKHFIKSSVFQLLDNYYVGPNINFPSIPTLIGPINFVYTSKRIRTSVRPSQIYPFLAIAPNIPRDKLSEISNLYDTIVIKYMDILNNTVSSLPEVNERTIKTINMSKIQIAYAKDIQADFIRIQKILSEDAPLIIRKVVYSNIVPLLDQFYKGPPIHLKVTQQLLGGEYKIKFRYPNNDKRLIFTLTKLPPIVCPPGTFVGPNGLCQCPPGQGLVKGKCQPYCPKGSYFAGTISSFGGIMAACNFPAEFIKAQLVNGRVKSGTGIYKQKPAILIPTIPVIQPKRPVDNDTD